MENYRPSVLPKLGLDFDTLRATKPDIMMASFCAYGNTGPYAGYRGNGTTIEAISGWDSLFGYPEEPPIVMGFYQADAITGLQDGGNHTGRSHKPRPHWRGATYPGLDVRDSRRLH